MKNFLIIAISVLSTIALALGGVAVMNVIPSTKDKLNISYGTNQLIGNQKENNNSELEEENINLTEENALLKQEKDSLLLELQNITNDIDSLNEDIEVYKNQILDLENHIVENNVLIAELESNIEGNIVTIEELTYQNQMFVEDILFLSEQVGVLEEQIQLLVAQQLDITRILSAFNISSLCLVTYVMAELNEYGNLFTYEVSMFQPLNTGISIACSVPYGYNFVGWSFTENGDIFDSANFVFTGQFNVVYAVYVKI